MAVFVRTKRVTDPLNDEVRNCLCGRDHRNTSYVSSGSEHEGDDSPCLSDLVYGFLEDNAEVRQQEDRSDSDHDFSGSERTDVIEDLENAMMVDGGDSFRLLLVSTVSKAVEMFSCLRPNKAAFRRQVMVYLRDSGYNAGICKTKWDSSGGVTAGSYEFIDVVRSEGSASQQQQRYFVDVDFAGEFEIARPTAHYEKLLELLPRVYVGRSEQMRRIVRLMCDAAKRSLKSKGLHLPPWRKNRYMQAKWFGPYKRTVNQVPASAAFPAGFEKFAAQCRSVGFDAVSDGTGGRFVRPATTRTR
ncbi:PREDICTED: uncharacterized protein LOC104590465 [Nelumbo nucifera]|uniref:Uncharacterized protein LOC104590465 n=2 Tax=Nelumbo nucifera TaxID=4432 RepID=A0A1U7Z8T6_NELNU|nr:PREDICTED: uncharacterized protein LOC104590465 [Nelumbo nucifera]DAD24082.1 TPA_asm: hypothetical protein HUJ06_025545 [Nelumbo nucifera]